jgi:phage baseplate assembly protein V
VRGTLLLQNAIRMQAVAAANLRTYPRLGTISGYDPARPAVKVMLQPEQNETGWIPLGSIWAGNGWGLFAAPPVGIQVEVTYIDGNIEAGVVGLRYFSDQDQALAVPSGEFWLVHANGQFVKLTNDGKLTVSDGQGATITLNGDGTITSAATQWTHNGPVHITGNVQVDQTLTANTDVVGGGISLKNHKTTEVQPGTGLSGIPV